MTARSFVYLAVTDLGKSIAFLEALGFPFNPRFTDEPAACMVVSDDIYAMLLTHTKFREFTNKKISMKPQACVFQFWSVSTPSERGIA